MEYIKTISGILDAVSDLTGFHAVWKNANGGGEKGIPERQTLHCNPFCKKIKGKHIKKCSANVAQIRIESEKKKKPFFHVCHAGAVELIVPIFLKGSYEGAVFAGTARQKNSSCPYKAIDEEFQKLPYCDKKTFKAIEKMLGLLARFISENRAFYLKELQIKNVKNEKIQKAIEYICKDFTRPISAANVAEECNLSASRFVHLFKESAGKTFSEFLTEMRIEQAKKLLSETNMKIYDVAVDSGFSEQSYFGAVFKKNTGCSPGSYRKKHRKNFEP
jgi:AraC-like DNA-binding protein/ligand-binding sensor protein